jgi:hypothetical protein
MFVAKIPGISAKNHKIIILTPYRSLLQGQHLQDVGLPGQGDNHEPAAGPQPHPVRGDRGRLRVPLPRPVKVEPIL